MVVDRSTYPNFDRVISSLDLSYKISFVHQRLFKIYLVCQHFTAMSAFFICLGIAFNIGLMCNMYAKYFVKTFYFDFDIKARYFFT